MSNLIQFPLTASQRVAPFIEAANDTVDPAPTSSEIAQARRDLKLLLQWKQDKYFPHGIGEDLNGMVVYDNLESVKEISNFCRITGLRPSARFEELFAIWAGFFLICGNTLDLASKSKKFGQMPNHSVEHWIVDYVLLILAGKQEDVYDFVFVHDLNDVIPQAVLPRLVE